MRTCTVGLLTLWLLDVGSQKYQCSILGGALLSGFRGQLFVTVVPAKWRSRSWAGAIMLRRVSAFYCSALVGPLTSGRVAGCPSLVV